MAGYFSSFIFFILLFGLAICPYPPLGEDVLQGSVLLPASRRGRYLANIIRRQAVDGTGIKFNKDADRMNAESKKKVDVLSDDLLPYIIAEQERRTTLYKRVMVSIQNGEKGITIAEIRNKPPLLIRRGLKYRCPTNRAPKEPDGSGVLMCEDDLEPTQVMYDSCLSAEDKDLYVADNKYFFCNRQREESPDLPRNDSTVIACSSIVRTSYNYTISRCSLEDTNDVVVHYRYYPDKSYKYVTEIDPDREVCDHWNPCQIGYIFSLPGPDQAVTASDIFNDYVERTDDFERDEIVQPIAEDSIEEWVYPNVTDYTTSARKVRVPDGHKYSHVTNGKDTRRQSFSFETNYHLTADGKFVIITLTIPSFQHFNFMSQNTFFVVFLNSQNQERRDKFLRIMKASVYAPIEDKNTMPGRPMDNMTIPANCYGCMLQRILVRSRLDNTVHYLDGSKFEASIRSGGEPRRLRIKMQGGWNLMPKDFGDYFGVYKNKDGMEERVKLFSLVAPENDPEGLFKADLLKISVEVGGHFDKTIPYTCEGCDVEDILCNGDSVQSAGRVTVVPESKLVSFNFPRFEDTHACVYIVMYRVKDKLYKKTIAQIENKATDITINKVETIPVPPEGEQFNHEVHYTCEGCVVAKVIVNGITLQQVTRNPTEGVIGFFEISETPSIIIRITDYTPVFEGIYQATFNSSDSSSVTKTILEISKGDSAGGGGGGGGDDATTAAADGASSEGGDPASDAPADETTEAPPDGRRVAS